IGAQCLGAGLVWGHGPDLDSTAVAGTAGHDSLRPRFAVAAHLAALVPGSAPSSASAGDGDDGEKEEGDAKEDAGPPPPPPLPRRGTAAAPAARAAAAAARQARTGEAGRPDRARTSGPDRRAADSWAGPTDLDASPLRPTGAAGLALPAPQPVAVPVRST